MTAPALPRAARRLEPKLDKKNAERSDGRGFRRRFRKRVHRLEVAVRRRYRPPSPLLKEYFTREADRRRSKLAEVARQAKSE